MTVEDWAYAGIVLGWSVFAIAPWIMVLRLVMHTRFWHRRYHRNGDHALDCEHCWTEMEATRD